ncbi:protein PIP-1-like isoform X3 [Anolis carolinensis]|uniref:protein PIP-1-like isoform X3 n=1 Tax=Anolis carolinensis TaxID=28377 RepID=UPI002F2B3E06
MSICISRGIKGTSSQSWTGLESSVFFLDDLECCSNTLILKMSLTCQILLISICAFFHLAPGDAMKCHACSALNESGPCEPVEDCEIDENEACSATKVYEEGEVFIILRSCSWDKSRCGTTEELKDGRTIEVSCCEDGDFCNDNL